MTLKDAEKIVQEYGAVLAKDGQSDGLASFVSRLPDSPERIIQAMKLWLACDIQKCSLTAEFRNELSGAASRLPFFIDDEEARLLNSSNRNFLAAQRTNLSTDDFMEHLKAVGAVHNWTEKKQFAGMALQRDLSDFITQVEQFSLTDLLYWQRVYTLAGLEYLPPKKRSFWDLFS